MAKTDQGIQESENEYERILNLVAAGHGLSNADAQWIFKFFWAMQLSGMQFKDKGQHFHEYGWFAKDKG
jgi:hypothetical protein